MRNTLLFVVKKAKLFIKPHLFIVIVLLLPVVLAADYGSDIQAGNAAYKAKKWAIAVSYYKQAYAVQPSAVLKKFIDSSMTAAFKDAVAKGNEAKNAGNLSDALKWYKTAYAFYPVKQLGAVIERLKKMPGVTDTEVVESNGVLKWVVIGADAALTIGTVAAYAAAAGGVTEYNTLYDTTDNTSEENYQALMDKKKSVEGQQNVFGVLAVITGLALAYTAVDLFVLHQVFPQDMALTVKNRGDQLAFMIEKTF